MRERLRANGPFDVAFVFDEGTIPTTNFQIWYAQSGSDQWIEVTPLVERLTPGDLAAKEYRHLGDGTVIVALPSAARSDGQWVIAKASGDGHASKRIWNDLSSVNREDPEQQTRDAIGLAATNLDGQLAALSVQLVTIDDYLDTEVDAIHATAQKLDNTLELNAGTWRFTAASLATAPTGGGGGATDYPLEADVRSGVSYNFGAFTGELLVTGAPFTGATITNAFTIKRGDTWSMQFTGLGDLTGKSVAFTIKRSSDDLDTESVVQITSDNDLTFLNANPAADPTHGTITIDNPASGVATMTLEADATAALFVGDWLTWDIQTIDDGDDTVKTVRNANHTQRCSISGDATRLTG